MIANTRCQFKSAVGLETVEDYFKKQDWAQVFGS